MDFIPPFANWLSARRQQLGMTQGDLARRIGCATITIRKFESGERQPSHLIAERLGEHLAIPDSQHAAFVAFATGKSAPDDSSTRGNLPTAPNPLIGRATELALARKLLNRNAVRLITLVGPPGVGKTRLAQQIATNACVHYDDGAWFVTLAAITDTEQVTPAIATSLGIRLDTGQEPLEILKRNLRQKHLLLVLDNFEQLLAAAPQVAELLAIAPGLKVVATSRAALHITGEHELPVPPLALPDQHSKQSVALISRYPSVELFIERARAVQPGFILNALNAPSIVAICNQLDGIPLAIELAAAHIKHATPQILLAGISADASAEQVVMGGNGQVFNLLSNGPRDLPSRQQTLWDTIDWSYNLLSEAEQRSFRRLSVFVGGCTQQAAEAVFEVGLAPVAPASGTDHVTPCKPNHHSLVTDLLNSLVDKSLLHQSMGSDGGLRYNMLELIREYAMSQLDASDEADAVRHQHAEFYSRLVDVVFPYRAMEEFPLAIRLGADHANLYAALVWCQDRDDQPELEVSLAALLNWHMSIDGLAWGHHRLTTALAIRGHAACVKAVNILDKLRLKPRLLQGALLLLRWSGDATHVQTFLAEALAAYRRVGDYYGEACILYDAAFWAYHETDYAYAAHMLNKASKLWQAAGEEADAALASTMLGRIALEEGRTDEAVNILTQALGVWQRLNIQVTPFGGVFECLLLLGLIAQLRNETARAIQYAEECLKMGRDSDDIDKMNDSWALMYLGRALMMDAQIDRTAHCILQSLPYSRDLENCRGIMVGLDILAVVRWEQNRLREAVTLVAAADSIRRALGAVAPVTLLTADHTRMLELTRPRLADTELAAAWAAGERMDAFRAVDYALAS